MLTQPRPLRIATLSSLFSLIAMLAVSLGSPRTNAATIEAVPQSRVVWTAESYRSYEWYANNWPAPQVGVFYKWGGFNTIAQYQDALTGSLDPDNPIAGVDCSGFVSRAWELTGHLPTWELDAISTPVARASVQAGDIFLDQTGAADQQHVVLYYKTVGGQPWYFEAAWNPPNYPNVRRVILNKLDGWARISPPAYDEPAYRYNNITANLHTYLPYVKANGWHTYIRAANVESSSADVWVEFFDSAGDRIGQTAVANVAVNRTYVWDAPAYLPPGVNLATAIVKSNRAISVSTEVSQDSPRATSAYSGVTNGSDRIFLPNIAKAYAGWTTDFVIMNIGRSSASISYTYYQKNGGSISKTVQGTVPPGGFVAIDPATDAQVPSNFQGSVMIRSDNSQIVAAVRQQSPSLGATGLYAGLNSEDLRRATRVPIIMYAYHDWTTAFVVENAGIRTTNVEATYRWNDGTTDLPEANAGSVASRWALFMSNNSSGLPDGFRGSGIATSEVGVHQPLASIAVQHKNSDFRIYEGTSIGSKTYRAPTILRSDSFDTGIEVQNLEDVGANVTLTFYTTIGAYVTQVTQYIPPRSTHSWYLPGIPGIPNPFDGSAKLTSNTRVGMLVNITDKNQTGDPSRAYTVAVPRIDEIAP